MATLGPYEVHPFAEKFALIVGDEFAELVDDIKRNGLRQKIVLTHDRKTLVDGRNRYRACEAAGVEPTFHVLASDYTEPQILDLIMSLNVARRQMSTGEKAMAALAYKDAYTDAIKVHETARKVAAGGPSAAANRANGATTFADLQKSSEPNHAHERAARLVGVSPRAVAQAAAVRRDTPDLAAAVADGSIALDAADRQRKERIRNMPRPEPIAARPAQVMLTLRTHTGDAVEYPKPQSKPTFNQTSGDGISWAEWSWNPVTGCLHGCDYCYAREIATSDRFASAYPVGFTPLFHEERLDAPTNTVIPAAHRDEESWKRVFVCSMADLYGRWVPDEWIERVLASCRNSPQWQYLMLTKFPSRYVGLDLPATSWLGTSVDEQKRVRIAEDAFRNVGPVAVKWLSLEPLREPLEFTDLSMFDWVVIGAQTPTRQPGGKTVPAFAPPFDWVARIYAQAREAGCRVHMKPNLFRNPGMTPVDEYPEPRTVS